ncbi:MAG: hypothetical protein V3R96_00720 [Dehalococcoidales bacterium]
MSARAYVLLDVTGEKAEHVAQTLRSKPGVAIADLLEGPPDVVLMVEAPNRQKLAKLTVGALASVESMTEDIWLLPVPYKATVSIKKAFVT